VLLLQQALPLLQVLQLQQVLLLQQLQLLLRSLTSWPWKHTSGVKCQHPALPLQLPCLLLLLLLLCHQLLLLRLQLVPQGMVRCGTSHDDCA